MEGIDYAPIPAHAKADGIQMFNKNDHDLRVSKLEAFDPALGKFAVRPSPTGDADKDLFAQATVLDAPWKDHRVWVVFGHGGLQDGKSIMWAEGGGIKKAVDGTQLGQLLRKDAGFRAWLEETEGVPRGIITAGCQSKDVADLLAKELNLKTWGPDVNSAISPMTMPDGSGRVAMPNLRPGGSFHTFGG